jgi:cytosine/adenosine deaminase-related metal-dependent hydrolase
MAFTLLDALVWKDGRLLRADVGVSGGRIAGPTRASAGRRVDASGVVLLPGLVNGHDHLDFSSFPALGRPPYASLYAWTDDVRAGVDDPRAAAARAVPLADRLWLGGLRNLLSGVTAVVHHGPFHRTLARDGARAFASRLADAVRHRRTPGPRFPVRVLGRYAHAHSPGLEAGLAATRPRSERMPWMIHAAEGTDDRARGEVGALASAGLLRPSTVLVHAIGLTPRDVEAVAACGAAVVWCPESNLHLYGATSPVAALRAAGVRLALGSDSPLSGVRDALSNLAVAGRDAVLDEAALLRLATRDTAAVFGLPAGSFVPGGHADFVAVDDPARFLAGDRRSVRLAVVAGRPLYGSPDLLDGLGVRAAPLVVEGEERRLETGLATRLRRLRRAHPQLGAAAWLAGVFAP